MAKDDDMPMLTYHALGFNPPPPKKDEDEDETPEPEPEPSPVDVDPFIEEIAKIKSGQSPAVKDTIDRATCFGRNWYIESVIATEDDTDIGGICDQWDCDLRSMCELVFSRATGKQLQQQKEDDPISSKDVQEIPQKGKKWHGPKRKNEPGKRLRYPYVDQGRPIDKMAKMIWELLGGPPSLPDSWMYPPAKTKEDRKVAPQQFRDRFGHGIMVSRRTNYQQYFKDGSHFLRLWMTAPGGGWLDVSGELSRAILTVAKDLKLDHPPQARLATRYRFYAYRFYLARPWQMKRLAKAFEHLGITPMAADHGQQENQE